MGAVLAGLYPPIRAAVLPGHLVACADRDPNAMRQLLARVRAGTGEARAALQAAATHSGPGTQLLARGDLADFIRGAMAAFGNLAPDRLATVSAPYAVTFGLRETRLVGAVEMDLDGLAGLMGALEKIAEPGTNVSPVVPLRRTSPGKGAPFHTRRP